MKNNNEELHEHAHSHSHEHSHEHAHTHGHSHSHVHTHSADGNILTAFFLNLFFVVVEAVGGLLTNSFAILSDSVHDLGDCAAIGCAYVLEKISKKAPDEKYTYGYRRYTLVSAIITSVVLVFGSAVVIFGSVERLKNPREIHGLGMLIIAVLGVIINGVAVLRTHKGTGANEKAISLHMLEDVLGWVAVLVGSVFIYALKWYFVDGLLSLAIAVFLLIESVKNLKDVFGILLEKTPEDFSVEEYKSRLSEVAGAEEIHHLHIWSLDGEKMLATLHIKIPDTADLETYKRVKTHIERVSREAGIEHLTLQIDIGECPCEDSCGI